MREYPPQGEGGGGGVTDHALLLNLDYAHAGHTGFAQSTHSHAESDITGLVLDLAGKAATVHSHAESDITGLVLDLAGKAASVHTHAESDVTNLVTDLSGKAASVHTHAESDVTNLTTDLSAKIAKTTNITALNETGIADGEIAVFNLTNKDIRTSDKTIVTTLGSDDTTVPTSKAVKDVTDTFFSLDTTRPLIGVPNVIRLSSDDNGLSIYGGTYGNGTACAIILRGKSHPTECSFSLHVPSAGAAATMRVLQVAGLTNTPYLDMLTRYIKNVHDPTDLQDAATKNYVDGMSGGGHTGQETIPFATWLTEDSVTVTGQTGILANSKVNVSLYANSDDVHAQDWRPPAAINIVAGTGFDIKIRPEIGTFKGDVKVNWAWT